MTDHEPTTPPEPDDQAPADPLATEDHDQDDTEPDSREAARYRRQLRDTEAERDGLAARLDTLQKAEVSRIVTGLGLTRPESIWAAGATMPDLLDKAGNVDADKVRAATETAIAELGLAVTRPPAFESGSRTPAHQSAGWADLLRGRS